MWTLREQYWPLPDTHFETLLRFPHSLGVLEENGHCKVVSKRWGSSRKPEVGILSCFPHISNLLKDKIQSNSLQLNWANNCPDWELSGLHPWASDHHVAMRPASWAYWGFWRMFRKGMPFQSIVLKVSPTGYSTSWGSAEWDPATC